MSIAAEASRRRASLVHIRLDRVLVALIAVVFAGRLHLVFASEVNWDEFLFLSLVHDFVRGDLDRVLQTAHVHLFAWLPLVSGNEVNQVIAARLVVFVLNLATAFLLVGILRQMLSARGALFAVFCYTAFSFVIQHASSFRADGIVTFLLVASIHLLVVRQSLPAAPAAGVLIGAAGMVTIKAALFLPTIGLLLAAQYLLNRRRHWSLWRGGAVVAVAGLSFVVLYVLHKASLADPAGYDAGGVLSKSYIRTIEQPGIFPQWRVFVHAVLMNRAIALVLTAGMALALIRFVREEGEARIQTLMLLSLAAPLATLLFYRNSFPYYYVFMLAPASVLCGVAADALPWREQRERATAVFAAVLIAVGAGATANYLKATAKQQSVQRATLEAVHRAFPEPVAYIDRCSMVSSFRKTGFFMSSWGMQGYYEAGEPVMRRLIAENRPRFLIGNIEALDLDQLVDGQSGPDHYRLFPEDVAVLRANYVHHWGAIYVAGKRFTLSPAEGARTFEIMVPGPYTLEGETSVMIAGKRVLPGDVVRLAAGLHRIAVDGTGGTGGAVTLRWGDMLYRPPPPSPEGPVFQGF